jgi:hypothetical protein
MESLGWRSKQAHDSSHDCIRYRRGECQNCGVTVSFLPAFSLPYTQYSLVARSEALRRRFIEGRSWEDTAPPLKDPDRVPAPSVMVRSVCPGGFRRLVQRYFEHHWPIPVVGRDTQGASTPAALTAGSLKPLLAYPP